MEHTDVLIIGAGVLGCFAARSLAAWPLDITVLERREDVCTGITRANTGIVYTGYDTKPGTLKTSLCVQANKQFETLCRELDVPFRRCGSLMIAYGDRGVSVIRRKYEDGQQNGVPGLQLLSGREVAELEPILTPGVALALFAPGTGTVNPWELGIAAYENAVANGVHVHCNEEVRALSRLPDGFVVESSKETYQARAVINCAGLASDAIRELCERPRVRIFPSAADYLVTDSTVGSVVRHVIFHEPEKKGKGLTLVPTVDGNILIGPTEHDWDGLAAGATDAQGLEALRELCKQIVPDLPLDSVIRSFGALRPNPYYVHEAEGQYVREERSISDLTILEEQGLYSLIGIKTPGLTCAATLGNHLANRVTAYLGCDTPNPSFSSLRKAIPCPAHMPEEERSRWVQEHPEYGHILCRCRGVSEGEIQEAIRRGAVTVDGIKRRTGAGMGRCQGAYCLPHVLEQLSEERKLSVESICKDRDGSEVVYGTL